MERYRSFGYQGENHVNRRQITSRLYRDDDLLGETISPADEIEEFVTYSDNWMLDESNGRAKRDNPLYFSQSTVTPCEVSGNTVSKRDLGGGLYRKLTTELRVKSPVYGSNLGNQIDSDDIEFITKAVGDTNPSSAQFNGLAFMAELRDLPSLVQSAGHTLAKFGANEYLKFQYGWRPFVQDVKKLTQLTGKIRKRMKHLERMHRQGTVRSNYDPKGPAGIKTYYGQYIDPYLEIPTEAGDIRFENEAAITVRRWAQIIWKPERPSSGWWTPGDDNRYGQALNAVYGLNLDGPQLWQAMPWSWLIDWVHNTSDYIKSQNNSVGATYKDSILMRESRTTIISQPKFERSPFYESSSLRLVAGVHRQRERVRILGLEPAVTSKTDGVGEILDSSFKSSIIGALGVQRLKGL